MVPYHPTLSNQPLQHSLTIPNGSTATAVPEVEKSLDQLLHHDVAEWPMHGFEQVKLRTVRRVFHGQLGDTWVHIKVFRADTIAAKTRKALSIGKGEREATHLRQVRELGLPAVEPLGYGLAKDGKHQNSFLVTRSIDSKDFAFPQPSDIASEAGALIRRIHDLGLAPGDLHPGNLLIDSQAEIHLCDLTSLHHVGEMPMRKRAAGLAFFCNPIDGGPLAPQTRAFLRGYKDAGSPMPDGFESEIARATRQLRATSLRSFGRRSTRSCKHTEAEPKRRATPRFFWHLADERENLEALKQTCSQFNGGAQQPLRSGRRGSVWLMDGMAIKERDAGKARKLWLATYWLMFARVPIATPMALCLSAGRGKVFTERLPNDDLATELAKGTLDQITIARAARSLGSSIGRLHGHGLRNRDLKFENLVRENASDHIAMVDLDGVSLHSAEETRGCGRDLGRLLAAFRHANSPGGEASIRRFLRAYVRTRRRMLQAPPMKRILRRAESRAGEWKKNH
jgi:tRNA A-37 threonylcarbamoyl transferase component Bud32